MPISKQIDVQTDFCGGQINRSAKRRIDLPTTKRGCLQSLNFRAEAQGSLLSRSGRRALFPTGKRSDYFLMSGLVEVLVIFKTGQIIITDLAGNVLAQNSSSTYLWTDATVSQISVRQASYDIVMCFANMQPQIARWDKNNNSWSFLNYTFAVIAGNKQCPFYRSSVLGASMQWDCSTSNYKTVGSSLTLTCSTAYFLSTMVGSVLSILGGQVTITAVISPTIAVVTVNSRLPDTVIFSGIDITAFSVGQIAASTKSGLKFECVSVGIGQILGPLTNGTVLLTAGSSIADTVSSPTASSSTTGYALYSGGTATVQWQEEFMSAILGWPASCFYDHNRLGFCNFPQRQEAILWATIGNPNICYIDSAAAATNAAAGVNANTAILEFVPTRPKVLNVCGTSDMFFFTDHGIFYCPVSATNPLKPGSVEFRQITNDGCSSVRPVSFMDALIYINAGGTRISVIRSTGAVTRPYASEDISDVHSNLFKQPVTLTISAGDGAPERICYVVNSDGSLVIGKFTQDLGLIGWHPESGAGKIAWVIANAAKVFFTVNYQLATILEIEDAMQFGDSVVFVNAPPANMVKSGFGVFWWLAGQTIALYDSGVDLGDRTIDANGNIVKLQGEVITSATLQGGTSFVKIFEPIVREIPASGTSQHQHQRRRRISEAMITTQSNCEYDWGTHTVQAYNYGDDASSPALLRERSVKARPFGRDYDPRIVLTSSRFGLIRIMECSVEVSI